MAAQDEQQQQKHMMRSSQTMPQLHYTREDIQEQYLAATRARQEQKTAATKRHRAQSSGLKKRRERRKEESSGDEDDFGSGSSEQDDEVEPDDENQRGRRRRSSNRKRRRRRAHSASIFSACFTIPNLSSMLTTSQDNNSSSQRRSLLQHLGLSSGQRRPISASQTTGNLQVMSKEPESSPLKPANQQNSPASQFGARKHVSFGQQQQQAPAQVSCQQQQRLNPSNNVIMRNYQAEGEANNKSGANQQALKQSTSSSSPIYLISKVVATQPSGSNHKPQVIYHQNARLPASKHSPSAAPQPDPAAANYPAHSTQNAQRRSQLAQAQQQATLYKRLPAVPMRTQATQTEITAYHLMTTPPLSTVSSGAAGLRAMDTTPVSSAAPTTAHSPEPDDDDDETSGAEQQEHQRSDRATLLPASSEEEWSAQEEGGGAGLAEPDEEENCGNLNASMLASSCSSSSASFVGHDSTLASSLLQHRPQEPAASESRAAKPGAARDTSIIERAGELKLKIDNKLATSSELDGSAPDPTREHDNADIEPPCQFKDSCENPSAAAAEPMNMNVGQMQAAPGVDQVLMAPPQPRPQPPPSPPSLSEASSQTTDASLARHIIDIGHSLERARPFGLRRDNSSVSNEDETLSLNGVGCVAQADEATCGQSSDNSADNDSDGGGPHTNRRDSSGAQRAASGSEMIMDNGGEIVDDDEMLTRPWLRADASDLLDELGAGPAGTRTMTTASAEQRRDHFLTSSELLAQAAPEPAQPSAAALSTRHHSYCSAYDFGADYLSGSGSTVIGEAAAEDIVRGQIVARASQDRRDSGNFQEDAAGQRLDLKRVEEEAGALSQLGRLEARAGQQTSDSMGLAANGPDKGGAAIRLPFMITGSNKSGARGEVSCKSLEDSESEQLASRLSCELLEEAYTASKSAASSSSRSNGSPVVVVAGDVANGTKPASRRPSEPPSLVSEQAEANSPPTTVSELDQDEELSTPSFVDSYKNRLAEVCQLADSVVNQLIGESLCREASGSNSSSNQSTSSTSVSGRSYICCHPKEPGHSSRRPVPPQKPAHLRPIKQEKRPEASAAALAVTATSIAVAAAVMHTTYQSVGVARSEQVRSSKPARDKEAAAEAAAAAAEKEKEPIEVRKEKQVQDEDQNRANNSEQEMLAKVGSFDLPADVSVSRSCSVCSATSVITLLRRTSDELTTGGEQVAPLNSDEQTTTTSPKSASARESSCSSSAAPDSGDLSAPSGREEATVAAEERQPSQELSTLSEVSEETSHDAAAAAAGDGLLAGEKNETPAANNRPATESTEHDLAHSEYTLRSQASETGNILTMASETNDSSRSEPVVRLGSLEHRRRSAGSTLTAHSSASSGSATPTGSLVRMKSPVDCPYVHDILPNLSDSGGLLQPAPGASSSHLHRRLSHDDTMEAIEDDVEGEEQELQAQQQQRQQQQHMAPSAPEGFERACTPAESIREEEEEEEEESSISVSQRGVLVESLSGVASANANERNKSSPVSLNSSLSPPSSGAATPSAREQEGEPADQVTNVASAPSEPANTQAILEHLSRHHASFPAEEPAPALEQSRSVDPQLRREFWRREAEMARETGDTGTMKRKPRSGGPSEPTSAPRTESQESAQRAPESASSARIISQRRGPPLSQMKAVDEPAPARPIVSQATDTSICSSCSCLASSFDQEQTKRSSNLVASGSSDRAAWMSLEEGSVFTENYWLSHWLYISEQEELEIWNRSIDMNLAGQQQSEEQQEPLSASMPKEMIDTRSTQSERNFSSKYKSTTRKMIHRRATIEMYKRIMNNTLKREKRVEISRSNGEFGFRIHGSRPVVVSAIERGTSAESCGLQVGDLIYAINGTNILDMAHSDVVKLAHSAESSTLVLDLVPTSDFLKMNKYNKNTNKRYEPLVGGFLMRLSPSTAQPLLVELQEKMSHLSGPSSSQQRASKLTEVMRLAWRQRYFILRSDNCLYWYKSPTDIEPLGGINLQGFSASLTNEFSEPNYVIRLVKYGGQPHYFGTNNMCDIQTWIDAINKAATEANQNDPYMKRTLTMAHTKPNEIPEPDCCGYLYKFTHKRTGGAHWRTAYFVLKDACLYLFRDQQDDQVMKASAVYYLHGYKVRNKHIEHKKHTFELLPPNRKTIRPMFLMANSETDKKRWIAALEYSIDRWIEID